MGGSQSAQGEPGGEAHGAGGDLPRTQNEPASCWGTDLPVSASRSSGATARRRVCADVTYIPMARGFACLVAIKDWNSRAVLAWKLSNTLGGPFCEEAFQEALEATGRHPEIFNTDQGCQFTSRAWIEAVEGCGAE